MRGFLGAALLSLSITATASAQGDSPGAPLATRDAQAAIRRAASEPAPRLPDGTPNLGRVGTEKGIWGLPGVLNFAQMAVGGPEKRDARLAGPDTGGRAKEPRVSFLPRSPAVFNHNSLNDSEYDPAGFCLPPGGARFIGKPFPA